MLGAYGGAASQGKQAYRIADTNGFSLQIRRRTVF